jgi:hypothetical protein
MLKYASLERKDFTDSTDGNDRRLLGSFSTIVGHLIHHIVMTTLFLYWRSTAEKILYICLQDLSKINHCLYWRAAVRKTDEISRILMYDHG